MKLGVATLLVGSLQKTESAVTKAVQILFCTKGSPCMTCLTCSAIKQKLFHSALWITPESRYTLDTIEPIFERSNLVLDDHQHMVFILENADLLTPATANALLKLVEEPPHNYHFIFTAQRASQVLPTIRSRCHIHTVGNQEAIELKPFEQFFTAPAASAQGFYSYLNTYCPSESETPSVVDTLLRTWIDRYQQALTKNDIPTQAYALSMITLLKKSLHQLPMPGSAKIFWKNLFLQKENPI